MNHWRVNASPWKSDPRLTPPDQSPPAAESSRRSPIPTPDDGFPKTRLRTPTRCTTWNVACGTCVRRSMTWRRCLNAAAKGSPIRLYQIPDPTPTRIPFTRVIWTNAVDLW